MIVFLTETSYKMASTLSQERLTILFFFFFLLKVQNCVYDFVQISQACGPKYLSKSVRRDFGLPMSAAVIVT